MNVNEIGQYTLGAVSDLEALPLKPDAALLQHATGIESREGRSGEGGVGA